jgi:hypothetical protein
MKAHTTTDHIACFHPVKQLVKRFFIGRHSPRSCRARPGPLSPRKWPPVSPLLSFCGGRYVL